MRKTISILLSFSVFLALTSCKREKPQLISTQSTGIYLGEKLFSVEDLGYSEKEIVSCSMDMDESNAYLLISDNNQTYLHIRSLAAETPYEEKYTCEGVTDTICAMEKGQAEILCLGYRFDESMNLKYFILHMDFQGRVVRTVEMDKSFDNTDVRSFQELEEGQILVLQNNRACVVDREGKAKNSISSKDVFYAFAVDNEQNIAILSGSPDDDRKSISLYSQALKSLSRSVDFQEQAKRFSLEYCENTNSFLVCSDLHIFEVNTDNWTVYNYADCRDSMGMNWMEKAICTENGGNLAFGICSQYGNSEEGFFTFEFLDLSKEREEVTLAFVESGLDFSEISMIVDCINVSQSEYYYRIIDYYEMAFEETEMLDAQSVSKAAKAKMISDMKDGNAPDLICFFGDDMRFAFEKDGYLQDLADVDFSGNAESDLLPLYRTSAYTISPWVKVEALGMEEAAAEEEYIDLDQALFEADAEKEEYVMSIIQYYLLNQEGMDLQTVLHSLLESLDSRPQMNESGSEPLVSVLTFNSFTSLITTMVEKDRYLSLAGASSGSVRTEMFYHAYVSVGISTQCDCLEGAQFFVTTLLSQDCQNHVTLNPVRLSALKQSKDNSGEEGHLDVEKIRMEYEEIMQSELYYLPEFEELYKVVAEEVGLYTSGVQDKEKTINNLISRAELILSEIGYYER